MAIQVTSQEYHDGVGLTWDDTGQPLSKREGQAWWAGWDEGRKDGQIDMQEEMADEIERLREALRKIIKLDDDWVPETNDDYDGIVYEHCANIARAALGEKE